MANPPSIDGFNFGPFELNLDNAIEMIRRSGAYRVGLQVPEGLKRAAPSIAKQIREKTGAEVIISGDPCYGACDIDMTLCQEVDILLHLGHAQLGDELDNVIFLETRITTDLRDAAENALPHLRSKKVGVATTVQHVHNLDQAIEVLWEHGVEGLVGPPGGRIKYPGQVLGCCYSTVKALDVEEHLFIGTGQFHPLGMALATRKRVVVADPVSGEVSEIDPHPMLRRRFGTITRATDAHRFAILVSKKSGQRRMELAKQMKALGEAKGKEMFLAYLDNIEPDRILNLGVEAAVSTACPRIALDDAAKYRIPILTPPEFEVLVGKREWEVYGFDEIVE